MKKLKKMPKCLCNGNGANSYLRTGDVYENPVNDWSREGSEYSFKNIPVYDSPVIIADKSVLWLEEEIEE